MKRKQVHSKYNGKCAYCGCTLEKGWHVDHVDPKVIGGSDNLENLNPSCKYCNTYKGGAGLEEYRNQLKKMLNENHKYLFKSITKMNVAINMGSIKHTQWDGVFYFESQQVMC